MKWFRGILKLIMVLNLLFWLPRAFSDSATESSGSSGSGTSSSAEAKSAMLNQLVGAGSNIATGKMYSSLCASSPTNSWACPLATMSYVQAGLMMLAAAQSNKTADATTDYSGLLSTAGITGYDEYDLGTTPKDLNAAVSEGLGTLSAKGYSYDADSNTLTTPDGEYKVDDASSAGSIVSATGGSSADAAQADAVALDMAAKIAKDFAVSPSVSGMGYESYGGGGGTSSKYQAKGTDFSSYLNGFGRKPAAIDKDKLIAGKSRMLGNDNIGIKVDNIFNMVHRRYQAKRKLNNFLEPIISPSEK